MSDPDMRAMGRAVLLLLLASVLRWGWRAADPVPVPPGDGSAAGLLEESRARAASEEARGRPLGAGEHIDPNTASEEALDRLPGVGAATARAIVRFREAHGPYRRLEDLRGVTGIGPAALKRLAPHLSLSTGPAGGRSAPGNAAVAERGGARFRFGNAPAPGAAGSPRADGSVDINRAGPDVLETLPGIGPALARRIVAVRSEEPFSSVDDLQRVPGIGPATVERLRPLVVLGR